MFFRFINLKLKENDFLMCDAKLNLSHFGMLSHKCDGAHLVFVFVLSSILKVLQAN